MLAVSSEVMKTHIKFARKDFENTFEINLLYIFRVSLLTHRILEPIHCQVVGFLKKIKDRNFVATILEQTVKHLHEIFVSIFCYKISFC